MPFLKNISPVLTSQGVELELLDVGPDERCGDWGRDLPERLRKGYSHWLCRWVLIKLVVGIHV